MKIAENFEPRHERRKERRRMKNPWLTLGFLRAADFIKKSAAQYTQVRLAMAYLKGVDMVRDIIFYQIGIVFCVVFFTFGFALVQGAVIFWISPEEGTRIKAALGFGLFDLTAAFAALKFMTSSKVWLDQAAKHNECLKEYLKEENGRAPFSNGKHTHF